MSQQQTFNIFESPPPSLVVLTLSGEGTANKKSPDASGNFNFSGSTAGGAASNGAILFNSISNGEVDAKVQVDGSTVIINASNQLQAINDALIWTVITGNTNAVKGNGYFANAASGPFGLTVTLPATSAVGDTFKVYSMNSSGFVIGQGAGQFIQIGSISSTIGVTGNVGATKVGDSIELVCSVANTQWEAVEYNANFIIN